MFLFIACLPVEMMMIEALYITLDEKGGGRNRNELKKGQNTDIPILYRKDTATAFITWLLFKREYLITP